MIKAGFYSNNLFSELPSTTVEVIPTLPVDLSSFALQAKGKLISGMHELVLADRAARLEVKPDASFSLDFLCESNDQNHVALSKIELSFNPPIRILNVITSLEELSALVSDTPVVAETTEIEKKAPRNDFLTWAGEFFEKRAAEIKNNESIKKAGDFFKDNATPYIDKIAESKGWKLIVETAAKTSEKAAELRPVAIEKSKNFFSRARALGEETIDKAIDGLTLSQLSLYAIENKNEDIPDRLGMSVSGEFVVNQKIRFPLNRKEMPRILLNRFSPEISKLLAQFCVTSSQGTSLSRTFLGMISHFEGVIDAGFNLTPWQIQFLEQHGRISEVKLNGNQNCSAHAEFSTVRNQDNKRIEMNYNVDISYHDAKIISGHGLFRTTDMKLISCGQMLNVAPWSVAVIGSGNDIEGNLVIDQDSRIMLNAITISLKDPELKNDLSIPLIAEDIPFHATINFGISAEQSTIFLHSLVLNSSGEVAWDTAVPFDVDNVHTLFNTCNGSFHMTWEKQPNGRIMSNLKTNLAFDFKQKLRVVPIPELKLKNETMETHAAGSLELDVNADFESSNANSFFVQFKDTSLQALLRQFDMTRDSLSVSSDAPIVLKIDCLNAVLSPDGIDESLIGLGWKFSQSPTLQLNGAITDIVMDEMMQGRIKIRTSKQGVIHFEDGSGFYNHEFFNALLYPEHGKEKLASIIQYHPLADFLEKCLKDLQVAIGPTPLSVLTRIKHWTQRCKACGIVLDLAHAVSMPELAKMVSLFLFDRLDETAEIQPILENIVLSNGFDRYKTEELLDRAFPDFDFTPYTPVLRILERIFEGIPYVAPAVVDGIPENEAYQQLRLLPTANHLFDNNNGEAASELENEDKERALYINKPETRARIFKYATGFNIRQLQWLLDHHGNEFLPEQRDRLEHLIAIKKRIHNQEPREGSFVVQDFNISFFLPTLLNVEESILSSVHDITGLKDEQTADCETNEHIECFATWLTPEDVARLLSAGISSRVDSQFVQLNQARLLNYLVKRGRVFALNTFYELGAGSDRILTSMILSFLSQDQGLLTHPANRVATLSKLMGMTFPDRKEFMPGGGHAAESYYEKLYEAAHAINTCECVDIYRAAKRRMQTERASIPGMSIAKGEPVRVVPACPQPAQDDWVELTRAIAKADAIGARIVEDAEKDAALDTKTAESAQKAYAYAYRVAAAILSKYSDAFENEVFKKFYARTYESLLIQTLDDDLRNDIDRVRPWFAVRSKIPAAQFEKVPHFARRKTIMDVLYYEESARQILKKDPLVWLNTRPKSKQVDLTILFAPGVITEGNRGAELDTAFERLKTERGIEVIRADTGNIKSLAFNAEIIADEIRKIDKPFMLLGYSQGCANMMSAEAMLYGSTPDDRAHLNNMVARHFLFSALNGSIHATLGGELYRRTLIDGEKFLKSLAAVTSATLSQKLFNIFCKVLDAPLITMSLNSVESLSPQGLADLSIYSQFQPCIISTELHGITENYIPESLLYMTCHHFSESGILSDSQVGSDCSHGYFVYSRNASVDILRRENIPSFLLNAHHWFPIYKEVQFIETERDKRDEVYHAPKDIHIMPPIEALILFGRLHKKRTPSKNMNGLEE